MDFDKYLEGQSMQRPPPFESDSFIYWKNRFETYVKSKDLDLWHVITNGVFQPIVQNPETKLDEVIPFEKQTDDLKKRLAKNNEAWLFSMLCQRIEYEDCRYNTANKRNLENLLITIKLRITFRKFLGSPPKWRAKVTTIEESKDLTSLLLAKERISDEECSNSGLSEDEEYGPWPVRRDFRSSSKVEKRKCFRCGDPNHLIGECPKPPKDKNQRAFVRGSWSDSGEEDDEKVKDENILRRSRRQ
ncbi:zf-CCHC domain-containing protein [Tanacetum coccineum]